MDRACPPRKKKLISSLDVNLIFQFLILQRENLEMFLKGCEAFGLKSQDLFQVNDLYENKNLYMVTLRQTCVKFLL